VGADTAPEVAAGADTVAEVDIAAGADIVAADTAGIDPAAARIGADIVVVDTPHTAAGHKAERLLGAVVARTPGVAALPDRVAHRPAAVPVRPQRRAALFLWRRSRGIRCTKGALHARIEGKSR
jgi:hypothetical protein